MLGTLFSGMKKRISNDVPAARRRYQRRECDRCVSVVNGRTYPVENWSPGGVLLTGDARTFGLEQAVELTMKFKLRNKIIDLTHEGKVIRKNSDTVAIQFTPLNYKIQRGFQRVIDDHLATEFASSQMF